MSNNVAVSQDRVAEVFPSNLAEVFQRNPVVLLMKPSAQVEVEVEVEDGGVVEVEDTTEERGQLEPSRTLSMVSLVEAMEVVVAAVMVVVDMVEVDMVEVDTVEVGRVRLKVFPEKLKGGLRTLQIKYTSLTMANKHRAGQLYDTEYRE